MALCVMAEALLKNQRKTSQGLLIQMPNRQSSDESTTPHQQSEQAAEMSTLFSVVLIVFESLLTFLLRHDTPSQRLAERLVARHAVIRVRTHLPAYTFYATFSHHGVLLDGQAPESAYLATVDGSIPTLFRAFMTAPPQVLDGILIHGDEELVLELRELMTAFNISNMLSNWVRTPWFSRNKDRASTPSPEKQQRIKPLLRRIDEQKKQIEQLNSTVKQQADDLQELRFRYRMLVWTAAIIIMVMAAVIVSLLLR